jgi:tetratricopeptide (TPR) repeat protein
MLEKKIYKLSPVNHKSMFFKIIIGLVCLTLLPFDLLTFITGTPSAKADELIEYKLQQGDQVINTKYSYDIRSQLWLTDIASLKEEKKGENELKLLVEKIGAVELMPQDIASEEPEISKQIIVSEPNDKEIEAIELDKEDVQEIESDIQYENITNYTLKKIMELTKQPEKVHNPFELGETLFLSDNPKEAAIFYKEALRRQDPNNITSTLERAWLLFQTGNCLRDYDRIAAKEYYGKLITEYPDLPWADLAKIQSDLIDWYNQNNPQELIQEYKI